MLPDGILLRVECVNVLCLFVTFRVGVDAVKGPLIRVREVIYRDVVEAKNSAEDFAASLRNQVILKLA